MAGPVVLHVWIRDCTTIDWNAFGLKPYRVDAGLISFAVAESGDLDGLITATVAWLDVHRASLVDLVAAHQPAQAALDFAYDCRLGEEIAVQGETIPLSLITRCAALAIRIDLSLYPPLAQQDSSDST